MGISRIDRENEGYYIDPSTGIGYINTQIQQDE